METTTTAAPLAPAPADDVLRLDGLAPELLCEIADRLPLKDLAPFLWTCKAIRTSVGEPSRRRMAETLAGLAKREVELRFELKSETFLREAYDAAFVRGARRDWVEIGFSMLRHSVKRLAESLEAAGALCAEATAAFVEAGFDPQEALWRIANICPACGERPCIRARTKPHAMRLLMKTKQWMADSYEDFKRLDLSEEWLEGKDVAGFTFGEACGEGSDVSDAESIKDGSEGSDNDEGGSDGSEGGGAGPGESKTPQ